MVTSAERSQVLDLAAETGAADGAQPLNEEARLALAGEGAEQGVTHQLAYADGRVVGYAQANPVFGTGQLFVAPSHRRRGLGSRLLSELGNLGVWAFGDLPAAQGFAAANGRAVVRRLLVLETVASDSGGSDPTIRPFAADTDAEALIAVNAAAFAWHPEQRHFSRADLDARLAEDWFDPAGLLVVSDDEGLVGFHWTKPHPGDRGEVYLLATHPRAHGSGIGRRLLTAGLDHLVRAGHPRVFLYVDASNTRAVELYRAAGFVMVHTDALYGPATAAEKDSSSLEPVETSGGRR